MYHLILIVLTFLLCFGKIHLNCISAPCRNDADCLVISNSTDYKCECKSAWIGKNCDISVTDSNNQTIREKGNLLFYFKVRIYAMVNLNLL